MISIVIPTYNESQNILILIQSLTETLRNANIMDYEVLVMDDNSPDGTFELVKRLGNPQVLSVNRKGRSKGLSYSVIDGIHESRGEIVGVMDADLSHPVAAVPALIEAIKKGANLAVGSRYVPGGGVANWPLKRQLASRAACLLGNLVTPVHDSTSGFFFFRKEIIQAALLSPLGFKIGLEVFVKAKHEGKITEVPYVFKDREAGESKLSGRVISYYFQQVFALIRYRLHKDHQ